jgi:hypothetical protein
VGKSNKRYDRTSAARESIRPWSTLDDLVVQAEWNSLESITGGEEEAGDEDQHRTELQQKVAPDAETFSAAVQRRKQRAKHKSETYRQLDKKTSQMHRDQEEQVATHQAEQALDKARRAAAKQARQDYQERKAVQERIEREAAGDANTSGGGNDGDHRNKKLSSKSNGKGKAVRAVLSDPAEDAALKRIRDEHLQWLSQSPLQQNITLSTSSPQALPQETSRYERSAAPGSMLPDISPQPSAHPLEFELAPTSVGGEAAVGKLGSSGVTGYWPVNQPTNAMLRVPRQRNQPSPSNGRNSSSVQIGHVQVYTGGVETLRASRVGHKSIARYGNRPPKQPATQPFAMYRTKTYSYGDGAVY